MHGCIFINNFYDFDNNSHVGIGLHEIKNFIFFVVHANNICIQISGNKIKDYGNRLNICILGLFKYESC